MLTLNLDEGDRQLVLLALATLALERRGFDYALNKIAMRIDNHMIGFDGPRAETYDEFRRLNADKFPA